MDSNSPAYVYGVDRAHALPLKPWPPNEGTIAAMGEARSGHLERVPLEALKAVIDERRYGLHGAGC